MSTKAKASPRLTTPLPDAGPPLGGWVIPPTSPQERLQRIEALGDRIAGYIRFMSKARNLSGTSAEAKELAVSAFYERLVVAERQLGRIQEDLQLG